MPTLTLVSLYSKNSDLVISAQELRSNYLYGIVLQSPFVNVLKINFSDADIEFHIRAAQQEIENYLSVKLKEQIYDETLRFSNDEWRHWGYMKTNFDVTYALRLEGFLNTTKQTTYPAEWLSVKTTSDKKTTHKAIYIVPAGNTGAVTNSVVYAGILPNLGYLNAGMIPNYWTPTYVTGFHNGKIPYDIMQVIGDLATISLLLIAGANIFGWPGLQSQSLSIDGLSQSMSTNLNAFGQRIKSMQDSLLKKLEWLQGTYRGMNWIAV